MKNPRLYGKRAGFTIVEMLFAMTILLLVLGGVLPMYVQSSKSILTADSKLDVNMDIRSVTDEIIESAREADSFVLYDNYKGAWIDGDFVNFRNSLYAGQGRLRDGETGRFLVLLYYADDPYPADNNPPPLRKIIGIYLDAEEADTKGALRMFVQTSIDDNKTMEENIPSATLMGTHEAIIDSMTGLMSGDVFYNFGGQSVMINGKITHANGAIKETNTYNFTVTPR